MPFCRATSSRAQNGHGDRYRGFCACFTTLYAGVFQQLLVGDIEDEFTRDGPVEEDTDVRVGAFGPTCSLRRSSQQWPRRAKLMWLTWALEGMLKFQRVVASPRVIS